MLVMKGMYDKEFQFDNNGKEESIILKPLPLGTVKDLFKIMNAIQKHTNEDKTVDVLGVLADDDVIADKITKVIKDTVKKSYPDMAEDVLDDFVAVNMFTLLPLVIEVNFKQ